MEWSEKPGIARNLGEVASLHQQKLFTIHPQKTRENW